MIETASHIPGGMPVQEFLEHYWQKKPLYLPRAFDNFNFEISKKDVFEAACNENIESRLVQHQNSIESYTVQEGPFETGFLEKLPQQNTTLLIQKVNTFHHGLHRLLKRFRFIPDFRLDDIMLSWAQPGGGVGPHIDNYDVFLIQFSGNRNWQISENALNTDQEQLIDNQDIRILADFKASQSFDMSPGDMLYLPPRYAHDGVAKTDQITLSVGFRALSAQELWAVLIEEMSLNFNESTRYSDPQLLQQPPAEITPQTLQRIKNFLRETEPGDTQIVDAFGRLVTETVVPRTANDESGFSQFCAAIENEKYAGIERHPASRMCYFLDGNAIRFYCSSEKMVTEKDIEKELIQKICNDHISISQIKTVTTGLKTSEKESLFHFLYRLYCDDEIIFSGEF